MILSLFRPLFVGFFADPFQGSAAKPASIGQKILQNQSKTKNRNSLYGVLLGVLLANSFTTKSTHASHTENNH